MDTKPLKLIDLHCDTLDKCADKGLSLDSPDLHFCIARRPAGLHICQASAIFIDSKYKGEEAQSRFLKAYDVLLREEKAQAENLILLRDLRDISSQLDDKPIALFLTVEGGSLLDGEIAWVDKLHRMGTKMLTLTWNGENELCGGVGSEKGFTAFGRQVVARMEELGMAVDASHMNDDSFWQLCEFASRPFCASHSNSRTVCHSPRNLTDEQFKEIARRGGVVGLNYYRNFIVEGGQTNTVDDLLRHLYHFLELGGEDTVALGSDFDGADLPGYIDGIEKLPALIDAIERSGVSEEITHKLLFGNAARFLETTTNLG
ncbi:MAG: membrane dipeptidase [Oscillospiraceae bacterium]|nr:membrane dipeptidase [Oscillospiraceae bacterium]